MKSTHFPPPEINSDRNFSSITHLSSLLFIAEKAAAVAVFSSKFGLRIQNPAMFRTENPILPPPAVFVTAGKRSPVSSKGLALLARSFDENLLRRLKALDPPALSLAWLSLAVGVATSTIADAEAVLLDLKLAGQEKSMAAYLDDSVKVLDVCNSVSAEIERLRQGRLLIHFVLHLLRPSGEVVPPKDLSRARASLAEYRSASKNVASGSLQKSATVIRTLVEGLGLPPKGKVSSSEKLFRRTIYAVGAVTVFVAGAAVAVLNGSPDLAGPAVTGDFLWTEAFNSLQSDFAGQIKQRFGAGERAAEVDAVVAGVRSVDTVMEGGSVVDSRKLSDAVNQLETVTDDYAGRLDQLSNGVNEFFRAVLSTRNVLLQHFRH